MIKSRQMLRQSNLWDLQQEHAEVELDNILVDIFRRKWKKEIIEKREELNRQRPHDQPVTTKTLRENVDLKRVPDLIANPQRWGFLKLPAYKEDFKLLEECCKKIFWLDRVSLKVVLHQQKTRHEYVVSGYIDYINEDDLRLVPTEET